MKSRLIKPRPYLDTNVILDYIRKRNPDSVKLMRIIKRKKINCWTSYYTILELIDREQESIWIRKRAEKGEAFDDILRKRHPRKLVEKERRKAFAILKRKFFAHFIETEIVAVMRPSFDAWEGLLDLLQAQNFSIGDAFQVGAAIGSNCNVFISNDSELVKMIEEKRIMLASRPKELQQRLADAGMIPLIQL